MNFDDNLDIECLFIDRFKREIVYVQQCIAYRIDEIEMYFFSFTIICHSIQVTQFFHFTKMSITALGDVIDEF